MFVNCLSVLCDTGCEVKTLSFGGANGSDGLAPFQLMFAGSVREYPLTGKSIKVRARVACVISRRLTTSVGRRAAVNQPYAAGDVHGGRLLAAS